MRTRRGTFASLTLAFAVLLSVLPLRAQTLEAVVMPGQVIEKHAKIEMECGRCHVRFEPSAQLQRCLDCHKEIAADVRGGTGYHGRIPKEQCRTCHTDHKGRSATVVFLDERKFDHRLTDFALRGDHRRAECSGCHRAGRKHRDAPSDCNSCHRGNDKHKGGLGTRCDSCHNEDTWKDGRFDHGKTRFALLFRHARAACTACHVDERYAGTPRDCVSCHRTDDVHKGHHGPRCESCHTEQDWKTITFRHERDTRYPLLGRHRPLDCQSCHRAPLYNEKPATQCVACHRKDDVHKGVLGEKCTNCHTEDGWRGGRFDHDLNTRFRLRDKHRTVKCESCHLEPGLRTPPPLVCVGCHERDDRERGHRGQYGRRCETCHVEAGFRTIAFDHDRDTEFAVSGRHRTVRCDACHPDGPYRTKADRACYACHKYDDVHLDSFERKCERCHLADAWRKISDEAAHRHCGGTATPPGERSFWIPACAGLKGAAARLPPGAGRGAQR